MIMKRPTLVSPEALSAAASFASSDSRRHALCGVLVSADGSLSATDGMRAVRMRPQYSEREREEHPSALPTGHHEPDPVLIPRESALKFPKTAKALKGRLPLLRAIAVSSNAESVTLQATNLDSTVRDDFRPSDAQFPSLESVWPTGDPVLSIGFDPAMFAEVLKALSTLADGHNGHVRMDFFGPLKPVRVTLSNGAAEALVMPMQMPEVKP